jgi:hypothetical protein
MPVLRRRFESAVIEEGKRAASYALALLQAIRTQSFPIMVNHW